MERKKFLKTSLANKSLFSKPTRYVANLFVQTKFAASTRVGCPDVEKSLTLAEKRKQLRTENWPAQKTTMMTLNNDRLPPSSSSTPSTFQRPRLRICLFIFFPSFSTIGQPEQRFFNEIISKRLKTKEIPFLKRLINFPYEIDGLSPGK